METELIDLLVKWRSLEPEEIEPGLVQTMSDEQEFSCYWFHNGDGIAKHPVFLGDEHLVSECDRGVILKNLLKRVEEKKMPFNLLHLPTHGWVARIMPEDPDSDRKSVICTSDDLLIAGLTAYTKAIAGGD